MNKKNLIFLSGILLFITLLLGQTTNKPLSIDPTKTQTEQPKSSVTIEITRPDIPAKILQEPENKSFIIPENIDFNGSIEIDGTKPWSEWKTNYTWCSGSGTEEDPYKIEDININGTFTIIDDDNYSVLDNITIFNHGISGVSVINLINSSNLKALNSNISINGVLNELCTIQEKVNNTIFDSCSLYSNNSDNYLIYNSDLHKSENLTISNCYINGETEQNDYRLMSDNIRGKVEIKNSELFACQIGTTNNIENLILKDNSLKLTNSELDATTNEILIINSDLSDVNNSFITIENNTFYDFDRGLLLYPENNTDTTITKNSFIRQYQDGSESIRVESIKSLNISHNYFEATYTGIRYYIINNSPCIENYFNYTKDYPIYYDDSILNENNLIENNYLFNTTYGIIANGNYFTIRYNQIERTCDGLSISMGGNHSVVYNNTIVNGQVGGISIIGYNSSGYLNKINTIKVGEEMSSSTGMIGNLGPLLAYNYMNVTFLNNYIKNCSSGLAMAKSVHSISNIFIDCDIGISFYNSNGTTITNNYIENTKKGIESNSELIGSFISASPISLIGDTKNAVITDNTIIGPNSETGTEGMKIEKLYNSEITNNIVDMNNNAACSLRVSNSNNLIIKTNEFKSATRGVYFQTTSSECLFFKNTISDNTINAEDDGTNNEFDNGSMGNSWDDYTGEDTDGDGIGETPYEIEGLSGSVDNYPLTDNYNPITEENEENGETGEEQELRNLSISIFSLSLVLIFSLYLFRKKNISRY